MNKKKIVKGTILAIAVIGIAIILGFLMLVAMFWGSGTYYSYETQAHILLQPDNTTIQNSQENFIALKTNIESDGFTLDWTNYTDSKSYVCFHLYNVSIEGDALFGMIDIENESVYIEIYYQNRLPQSRSNESFQSSFENETAMLRPYNDMIINEIKQIYDVVLISEDFILSEGAISAD